MQWYDEVEQGAKITQGQIIFDCPVQILHDLSYESAEDDTVDFEGTVEFKNVIVLTQACDVQQGAESLILCPLLDIATLDVLPKDKKQTPKQAAWAFIKEVSAGKRPRYHLIGKYDGREDFDPMNYQIVDFGVIHPMPQVVLESHKSKFTGRLQMKTPHRELISQNFANFYSRIGLPNDDHIKEADVKAQFDETYTSPEPEEVKNVESK